MIPAKEVALVPEPRALSPEPGTDPMVAMIERLATNKDVDVEKLRSILDMQKGILAYNAEAAFNAAFAQMQAKLPTVVERGVGDKGMRYARLEDINEAVRPILGEFGFSMSHRTEWPDAKTVKVIGILTHREGHSRTSEFQASADQTGSKNAIQALGSSVHYGRRYTTKDLLNIATRGEDDDGHTAGRMSDGTPAPDGYEDWQIDMESAAGDGWPKLSAAFGKSKPDYRARATRIDKAWWAKTRQRAEGVK